MNNDSLDQIWNRQKKELPMPELRDIISKAGKQRRGQFLTISILAITVLILLVYGLYFSSTSWNDFTFGLFLMISSLLFRVILEFITLYRKENRLVALDNKAFRAYLKKHYRSRLGINTIITPMCFVVYIIGFTRLLPYFEREFSRGFYQYILISGILSLLIIGGIILYSILNEHRYLRQLKQD